MNNVTDMYRCIDDEDKAKIPCRDRLGAVTCIRNV